MTRKALPASIVLLFVLSVPLVGAGDDEKQPFVGVEGYHNPDQEGYCANASVSAYRPGSLCINSNHLADVLPETGRRNVFLPPTPVDRELAQAEAEACRQQADLIYLVNRAPMFALCAPDDYEPHDYMRDADGDGWPDETEAALCEMAGGRMDWPLGTCQGDDFQGRDPLHDGDEDTIPDDGETLVCGYPWMRLAMDTLDGRAGRCTGSPDFDYTGPDGQAPEIPEPATPERPVLAAGVPCAPPPQGDWIIPRGTQVTCLMQDIVVQGDVRVEPAAMLVLQDSRLTFKDGESDDGTYHLILLERERFVEHPYAPASIHVYSSTIQVPAPGDGAVITSGGQGSGDIVIQGSRLVDVDVTSWPGGDLLFEGNEITHDSRILSYKWGGEEVRIQDNVFHHVDIGAWLKGGDDVEVVNNTFTACLAAVVMEDVVPVFRDNTVSGCLGTVGQRGCQPDLVLRDNDFVGNQQNLPHICGDASDNYWGREGPGTIFWHNPVRIESKLTAPVHPERLPVVAVESPDEARVGDEVVFDASRSRPSALHDAALSFAWDFGDGQASGASVHHVFAQPGPHTVRLTVTDEMGFREAWMGRIYVTNHPPVVESVSIEPTTAYAGDALFAHARVHDPDDDAVEIVYFWYRDGMLVEGFGRNGTAVGGDVHGPGVPVGVTEAGEVWSVEVFASDGHMRSEPGLAKTLIHGSENKAPYFEVLQIMVNRTGWVPVEEVREGEAMFADVEVRDRDNDPLQVWYRWLRNGTPYGSWTNGSFHNHTDAWIPADVTRAGEIWEVVVTVTDGHHWNKAHTRVQVEARNGSSVQAASSMDPVDAMHASKVDARAPAGKSIPLPGLVVFLSALGVLVARRRH